MKKLFLILVLFIRSEYCAASYYDSLKAIFSKCSTKTELEKSFNTTFQTFKIRGQYNVISRSLDFGYDQSVYNLDVTYGVNNIKFFSLYILHDTSDSICFGQFQELTYDKEASRSESFIFLGDMVDKYLVRHNSKYNAHVTKVDFTNQLSELFVYGFGCSDGGRYNPPKAKEMIKHVKNGDYKRLTAWIKQINPELQAYGVSGLLILRKRGTIIDPVEERLIQYLQSRNSLIYSCGGCIFGIKEPLGEIMQRQER